MTAQFGYLLNAMERAACEHKPAEHDYKGKRIAVLGYVSALESERDLLRAELIEARKPDCLTCRHCFGEWSAPKCFIQNDPITAACIGGNAYMAQRDPVRLYEKEGKG